MTLTAVDICNQALDMVGTGRKLIDRMDEESPEGEACSRLFKPTLEICLEYYQWSFARRDEVIDENSLLPDVVSLPFNYSYKVPEDVMKVLFLTSVQAPARFESRAQNVHYYLYNFRNYDGQKVLATNKEAPFAIHYQCYTEDFSLFSPMFIEGFCQMLGAKLCLPLLQGTTGMTLYKEWYQMAMLSLNNAADLDASQGEETASPRGLSKFLQYRR